MTNSKRWLVAFDVMDTLIRDPWRDALHAGTGLSAEEVMRRRHPDIWPQLEQDSIAEADFWAHLNDRAIATDPAAFHTARRAGYRWLPGMRELVSELQARQYDVALATNYPLWIDELRDGLLADIKVPIYASCHLKVRKPSPLYFQHLLNDHHTDYASMVLIDDSAANTEAFCLLGGFGITHIDNQSTTKKLKDLGIL